MKFILKSLLVFLVISFSFYTANAQFEYLVINNTSCDLTIVGRLALTTEDPCESSNPSSCGPFGQITILAGEQAYLPTTSSCVGVEAISFWDGSTPGSTGWSHNPLCSSGGAPGGCSLSPAGAIVATWTQITLSGDFYININ